MGRAMAADPCLPKHWQECCHTEVGLPEVEWKNASLKGLATMALTKAQIERMAKGKSPGDGGAPLAALIADQWRAARRAKKYRAWRAT